MSDIEIDEFCKNCGKHITKYFDVNNCTECECVLCNNCMSSCGKCDDCRIKED